jgi:hypothetical protein
MCEVDGVANYNIGSPCYTNDPASAYSETPNHYELMFHVHLNKKTIITTLLHWFLAHQTVLE